MRARMCNVYLFVSVDYTSECESVGGHWQASTIIWAIPLFRCDVDPEHHAYSGGDAPPPPKLQAFWNDLMQAERAKLASSIAPGWGVQGEVCYVSAPATQFGRLGLVS